MRLQQAEGLQSARGSSARAGPWPLTAACCGVIRPRPGRPAAGVLAWPPGPHAL